MQYEIQNLICKKKPFTIGISFVQNVFKTSVDRFWSVIKSSIKSSSPTGCNKTLRSCIVLT